MLNLQVVKPISQITNNLTKKAIYDIMFITITPFEKYCFLEINSI